MSLRTIFTQTTRSAGSLKTGVAIIIVIIVFSILHITAGVLLHNALAAPPAEPSRLVTYGD